MVNTTVDLERALNTIDISLGDNIKYDISMYLQHSKHANTHFAFIIDLKRREILYHDNNVYHSNASYPFSRHAEVQAIVKYSRNKQVSNNKKAMLVVRITKSGTLTNSRCCRNCVDFIREHVDDMRLCRVYYSSTSNTIDVLTKKDLISTNFVYSSGYTRRQYGV